MNPTVTWMPSSAGECCHPVRGGRCRNRVAFEVTFRLPFVGELRRTRSLCRAHAAALVNWLAEATDVTTEAVLDHATTPTRREFA